MTREQAIEVLKDMRFGATKEQAEALNKAIIDLEAIENGIQAKALRKKGTEEWYYQWEGAWAHGGIPEELGASLDAATLPPRLYPPDAELVDVTIIVNDADIKP